MECLGVGFFGGAGVTRKSCSRVDPSLEWVSVWGTGPVDQCSVTAAWHLAVDVHQTNKHDKHDKHDEHDKHDKHDEHDELTNERTHTHTHTQHTHNTHKHTNTQTHTKHTNTQSSHFGSSRVLSQSGLFSSRLCQVVAKSFLCTRWVMVQWILRAQ